MLSGWKTILLAALFASTMYGARNPCQDAVVRLAADRKDGDLDAWTKDQVKTSAAYLWENLNPPGTAPGSVAASPEREHPNYWFHWVRDASLAYDPVVTFYANTKDARDKGENYRRLMDFARFSRGNQTTPTMTGQGEPKFNMDGSAFNGPWGRPQNDGPAARAVTLTHFAQVLLNEGNESAVRENLYRGEIPAQTVIKADLEYVAYHWRDRDFDLWEEIDGEHFDTLMIQRRAMLDGADLARRLNDGAAADFYVTQAREMEKVIGTHWNGTKGHIESTLNRVGGIDWKASNLDAAIVLGALHGDRGDGFMSSTDDRILASAEILRRTYEQIYPINQRGLFGTLIGRYPEDRYDGENVTGETKGNPWALLTNAFAELHYRAANEYRSRGRIAISDLNVAFFRHVMPNEDWVKPGAVADVGNPMFDRLLGRLRYEGDSYLLRTMYHANPDGRLNEQIVRDGGFMRGAHDLTWNYASILTAIRARNGGL